MENVPPHSWVSALSPLLVACLGTIVEPAFGRRHLTGESEPLGVALEALSLSPSFACTLLDRGCNETSNVTSCLALLPLCLF